jgi:hypothetical protein
VKALFRQGDYVGAYNYCKENPSPLTNVLRVGISLLGDGKPNAEEGMMGELQKENANMNTYISYLSVIGVCTPMIGLLGTVTGMIKAFANLGAAGIGDPSGCRLRSAKCSSRRHRVCLSRSRRSARSITCAIALRPRSITSRTSSTAPSARCHTSHSPVCTSATRSCMPRFRTGSSSRKMAPVLRRADPTGGTTGRIPTGATGPLRA